MSDAVSLSPGCMSAHCNFNVCYSPMAARENRLGTSMPGNLILPMTNDAARHIGVASTRREAAALAVSFLIIAAFRNKRALQAIIQRPTPTRICSPVVAASELVKRRISLPGHVAIIMLSAPENLEGRRYRGPGYFTDEKVCCSSNCVAVLGDEAAFILPGFNIKTSPAH